MSNDQEDIMGPETMVHFINEGAMFILNTNGQRFSVEVTDDNRRFLEAMATAFAKEFQRCGGADGEAQEKGLGQ